MCTTSAGSAVLAGASVAPACTCCWSAVFARATGAAGPPAATGGLPGLIPPAALKALSFARATWAVGLQVGITIAGLRPSIPPAALKALFFARATGAVGLLVTIAGLGGLILPAVFDVLVFAGSPVALLSLSTPELFELSLCVVQTWEGLCQVLRINNLFLCLFFLVFNIFFSPLGVGIGAPWSTRFCRLNVTPIWVQNLKTFLFLCI